VEQIDLEVKCYGQKLPMPIDSLYGNTEKSRPEFNKYDSPNAFWQLTNEQQAFLLDWCQHLAKRQRIYRGRTSYGLKHIFGHSGFYVCNGAFKGAMLLAGFKADGLEYTNWWFNVRESSVQAIIKREFNIATC